MLATYYAVIYIPHQAKKGWSKPSYRRGYIQIIICLERRCNYGGDELNNLFDSPDDSDNVDGFKNKIWKNWASSKHLDTRE